MELKNNQRFIGFIGFNHTDFQSDFTPCIEIGWRIGREYWGNGYATEGAKMALAYGFNNVAFSVVYSFTSKLNLKSENVMKKIGMKKVGEFNHPNIEPFHTLSEHVLYLIKKLAANSHSLAIAMLLAIL